MSATNSNTAVARIIARGVAWAGFWIGAGIAADAFINAAAWHCGNGAGVC